MLQFASLATVLAVASAYTTGYSNLGGLRGVRYGNGIGRVAYGGYLANAGLVGVNTGLVGVNTGYATGLIGGYTGYAGGYGYGAVAHAPLAVQTVHNVQYADVPSGGQINPISVEVDANPIPMNMLFRSASSQLNVQQAHQGAAGSVQESASEDEAHVLRHSVTKPVLQEVREVITPFRRITQEVQPVREEINTVIARGVAQRAIAVAAPVQAVQAVAAPVAVVNRGVAVVNRGLVGYGAGYGAARIATTGVQYAGVDADNYKQY